MCSSIWVKTLKTSPHTFQSRDSRVLGFVRMHQQGQLLHSHGWTWPLSCSKLLWIHVAWLSSQETFRLFHLLDWLNKLSKHWQHVPTVLPIRWPSWMSFLWLDWAMYHPTQKWWATFARVPTEIWVDDTAFPWKHGKGCLSLQTYSNCIAFHLGAGAFCHQKTTNPWNVQA